MKKDTFRARTFAFVFPLLLASLGAEGLAVEERVVLESAGWKLVGDWRVVPRASAPVPAALLLHRAAGSRSEYAQLADMLEKRGVASLRLDLRGHGDSDNLGRFQEPYSEHRALLANTYEDIDVALRWIAAQPGVASDRLASFGASYSGEAIGEALRRGGPRASAYVILSPGSFSDESIAEVDASGAAWLFIRTREESPASLEYIDAVFEALASRSKSAEIRILPGVGHATHIFDEHPSIVEEIADWLAERLHARAGASAP